MAIKFEIFMNFMKNHLFNFFEKVVYNIKNLRLKGKHSIVSMQNSSAGQMQLICIIANFLFVTKLMATLAADATVA